MSDVTDRLNDLLVAEKEALLEGDLARIAALIEEKEALVDALQSTAEPAEILGPLRDRIERNHTLYDHVLSGIRAVTSRLGSLQRIQKTLETYDSSGRRFSIETPVEGRLEKRA